jgi:two-component system, NarL family, response regulator
MSKPIRVLVVDDHQLLLDALRVILDAEDDIETIGGATSAEEAFERWSRESFNVVLMDVQLPGMDGIEAARRLRASHPKARVVVMTAYHDTELIVRAIEAGCSGYVPKTFAAQELVDVIRLVAAGETVIPQGELMQTLRLLRDVREARSDARHLIQQVSAREVEVLQLLAEGLSTGDISERLGIRPSTIRTHVRSSLTKLGVHSRLEAVVLALFEGLISQPAQMSEGFGSAVHPMRRSDRIPRTLV